MVYHERSGDKSGSAELPRTADTNWLVVGRVVYGWTDRRAPDADRLWWVRQRARIFAPVVRERPAASETAEA